MNNHQMWRWALVACGGLIGVGLLNLSLAPAEGRRPAAADKCCVATLDLNAVLGSLEAREVRDKELQAFIQGLQTKLEDLKKQAQKDGKPGNTGEKKDAPLSDKEKKELADTLKDLQNGTPEQKKDAQQKLANASFEFPAVEGVPAHPILEEMGPFRRDTLNAKTFGSNNQLALLIMNRAGWR